MIKKSFAILLAYVAIMGAGLAFTYHVRNVAYDSPNFGEQFLPFMAILAALAVGFAARHRQHLRLTAPTSATASAPAPGTTTAPAPASASRHQRFSRWVLATLIIVAFVPVVILAGSAVASLFALSSAFAILILDAILIGLAEEYMFRYILIGGLAKTLNLVLAVVLSATLFALLHVLNILGGFSPASVVEQVKATFVMGLFLGAVYLFTRSIAVVVAYHALWDFAILSNVLGDGSGTVSLLIFAYAASVIVAFVLLVHMWRQNRLHR